MAEGPLDSSKTLDRMSKWLNNTAVAHRMYKLQEEFHVPGLAIAFVSGRQICSKAFGYASLDTRVPCTTDTIFDAASTSKALTAVAAAILVDSDATINWETPMSTLLPGDFVMATPEATNQVSLEDILSHQSGLPGHDDSVLGVNAKIPDTPRTITRNLHNLPLSRPIKSQYQYSNMMYSVATHFIETRLQMPFATFLKTNIFDQLGMASTFLQPSAVKAAKRQASLSTPYCWKNESFHEVRHQESPEMQGAGSLFTTADDFAKFLRAMLYQISPVSKAVYEAVTCPRIMRNPKACLESFGPDSSETAYALGWDIKYIRKTRVIAHDGVISGYGSRMFILPDHSFAAYIIGNSEGAFNLSAVLQADMIDELLDIAAADRYDRARSVLQKQNAQIRRREKNTRRNAERREQARGSCGLPLDAYVGSFWNQAYKEIRVFERDQELVVDGSDRSPPFDILLEHIKGNVEFRGYVVADDSGGEDILRVSFRVNGNVAQAVGINFEETLGDDHLFWFERIQPML